MLYSAPPAEFKSFLDRGLSGSVEGLESLCRAASRAWSAELGRLAARSEQIVREPTARPTRGDDLGLPRPILERRG